MGRGDGRGGVVGEDPLEGGESDPLDFDELGDGADGPCRDDGGCAGGGDAIDLQEPVLGGLVEEDEEVGLAFGSELRDDLLRTALDRGFALGGGSGGVALGQGMKGTTAHRGIGGVKAMGQEGEGEEGEDG